MLPNGLEFRLLGGHVIRHHGQNITLQLPHKGRALLVFLLLNSAPVPRKRVAQWLWPDAGNVQMAMRSLRVLLNTLRNKHALKSFLIADRLTLSLNNQADIWCDVTVFQTAVSSQIKAPQPDVDALRLGMDLYLGKFMLGFDVTNTEFDNWLLQQQIKLENLALQGLVRLTNHLDGGQNPRAAAEYAYRLVSLDPWREASCRLLMRVLAKSDRADAALHAYEQCRDTLERELAVFPEEETVLLAGQIEQGLIEVVQIEPEPMLPSQTERPFLAPVQTGLFVGRAQLMDRLHTALTGENGRFRTCLTGMGGIGKTTAAVRVAHLLRDKFKDGVLWADMAQQEPHSVAETWASAFGYDLHQVSNEAERVSILRTILSERQALLILDDIANASRAQVLLPETGPCKVLLTSRSEDVARQLDAMSIPLGGLLPENGRHLLAHYLGSERMSAHSQDAIAICEQLHYLPLAIVIAGNYLLERPQLSLGQFVSLLRVETQKLGLRHADRQVRASFNISWEALPAEARRLFNLLGVFDGRNFAGEAFSAVAGMDGWAAEAELQKLVQVSLLNRVENGRFRQHPLLAEFAREKLEVDDDAYRHMIAYYCMFAKQHQGYYGRLRPEWENFIAAIESAVRLHWWTAVIDLTTLLQPAWFARGRFTDARRAFKDAIDAAMYLEDEKSVADFNYQWGLACLEQSDYQQAESLFAESVLLYESLNDRIGIGNVKYEQARIGINRDDYGAAEALLLDSRKLYESEQHQIGVANAKYRLARLWHRKELYPEAKKLCEDALSIHEAAQNTLGIVKTLRLLTTVATMMQDYESALQFAEKALTLAQTIEDSGEIAMAYYAFSMAGRHAAQYGKALDAIEKSLKLLEMIGDRHSKALALYQQCLVLKSMANYAEALASARAAQQIFEQLDDKLYVVLALGHSGDCLLNLHQPDAACANWQTALRIADSIENSRLHKVLEDRLTKCLNEL